MSLLPGSLAFNPRHRRLSTPPDAYELHPDIRSYRTRFDDGGMPNPSFVLATAGYDHTVRFWEATRWICYRTLQYADSQVNKLEITPDKQYLAAAGNPHVRLYEGARVSRDRHSFTARPPSSLFAPPGGRLPHDADLSVPVSVASPVRRPRLTDATRPLDAPRSSLSTRSPHEQPAAGDVVRRALRKRQRGRVRTRGAVDVQRQRRRDGEDLGPARGGVPARVREQRRGDVRGVAPESGASRYRTGPRTTELAW